MAPSEPSHDVFVAYEPERDSEAAEALAARLAEGGLSAWLLARDAAPKEPLDEAAWRGLGSSRAGLLVLGEGGLGESLGLAAGWMRDQRERHGGFPLCVALLPGAEGHADAASEALRGFEAVAFPDGLTDPAPWAFLLSALARSEARAEPPRVFVSYSHDSLDHRERVKGVVDALRSDGVDCWADLFEQAPPQGWPRWMREQVEGAGHVLVVCTATYRARFEGRSPKGEGLGVNREGSFVDQALYDAMGQNEKFVPVLLEGATAEDVPLVLRPYSRFRWPEEREGLLRLILNRPLHVPGELGEAPGLPPGAGAAAGGSAVTSSGSLDAFAGSQVNGKGDEPSPPVSDEEAATRQELEQAVEERAELLAEGGDTKELADRIAELKRRLRRGPSLGAGDFLGDFRLDEPIGKGGFATVWKAYDKVHGRVVAVKVLHAQHAEDRSRRERFFRGAREMAQLEHPGIVRVFVEHGEDEGHHYFVMEYLAGGDLEEAVTGPGVDCDRALDLVLAVGEALEHAHERELVHRDVKPANVLLTLDGRPKLTDFDLVRAADTTGGTRTGALGSFFFAAPEVMQDAKRADLRADVYSLGKTLAFALHGKPLPVNLIYEPVGLSRRATKEPALRAVLERALANEPEERPAGVGELCEALREAREGSGEFEEEQAEKPSSPRQRSRQLEPSIRAAVSVPRESPAVFREDRWFLPDEEHLGFVEIPGGEFLMGSDPEATDENYPDESPLHRVSLPSFWAARYPTTVAQFQAFVRATGATRALVTRAVGTPDQPVANVSWGDARGYCEWLTSVLRQDGASPEPLATLLRDGSDGRPWRLDLASEAEWEKAARGTDGRRYPWGDEVDPARANYADTGFGATSPVGAFPNGSGPFGLLDTAGNVWEWTRSVARGPEGEDYWPYPFDPRDVAREDPGTEASRQRVVRGGSFGDFSGLVRCACRNRYHPSSRSDDTGFRVFLVRP